MTSPSKACIRLYMATARQKKAMAKLLENHGTSVSAAMRAAGYSPNTAKNPMELTKSKSWEELLNQYLPDDKLAQKIDEGLDANRVISAINTGKQASGATSDFIEVPDFAVRHKYVETSLKIKGKLIDRSDITSGGKPLPILGGITNVPSNNGDKQTSET